MQKILAALSLSILGISAASAADAPASPHTFTGNLTLASEYTYRGIAQTNRKPAVQGGFDYSHSSGVYVGTWASNVSWLSDGGGGAVSNSLELDLYGGYKFAAGPVNMDVGALYYYYPGTYPGGFTSPNTTEIYASAGWQWLTFKYSYSLSNLFGATNAGKKTDGSSYLDLSASYEVGGGFNLVGHIGRQIVKGYGDASYTDWKVGVTKELVGVTWGLSYIDTNAKGDSGQFYRNAFDKNLGKATLVLTAGKTF
jgi:uncharacterized protein (TIGR02001 family)